LLNPLLARRAPPKGTSSYPFSFRACPVCPRQRRFVFSPSKSGCMVLNPFSRVRRRLPPDSNRLGWFLLCRLHGCLSFIAIESLYGRLPLEQSVPTAVLYQFSVHPGAEVRAVFFSLGALFLSFSLGLFFLALQDLVVCARMSRAQGMLLSLTRSLLKLELCPCRFWAGPCWVLEVAHCPGMDTGSRFCWLFLFPGLYLPTLTSEYPDSPYPHTTLLQLFLAPPMVKVCVPFWFYGSAPCVFSFTTLSPHSQLPSYLFPSTFLFLSSPPRFTHSHSSSSFPPLDVHLRPPPFLSPSLSFHFLPPAFDPSIFRLPPQFIFSPFLPCFLLRLSAFAPPPPERDSPYPVAPSFLSSL